MSRTLNVSPVPHFANALRTLCALGSLHDRSLSRTLSKQSSSLVSFIHVGSTSALAEPTTIFSSSNIIRHTASPLLSESFSRTRAAGSHAGRKPTLSCATTQRTANSDTSASSGVRVCSICVRRNTRSREFSASWELPQLVVTSKERDLEGGLAHQRTGEEVQRAKAKATGM